MESTATPEDEPARAEHARADWRSLSLLRDRVEAAAREIERLRSENAALGKRLLDMQDNASGASFSFGDDQDTDALRARVQGFIDTIDGLLAQAEPGGDGSPDA